MMLYLCVSLAWSLLGFIVGVLVGLLIAQRRNSHDHT